MAPSLVQDDDLGEPDLSDIRERFEVRMEEGLDSFVVLDGLPKVPEASKDKLAKFLLKKLNTAGRVRIDKANDEAARNEAIFMPIASNGDTEGFAFVEYETPEQAAAAVKQLHETALDKKHILLVNKLTDIERFGREGRIEETFTPPQIDDYQEKPYLRSWLGDPQARDQFVLFRGDNVGVFWNRKKDAPDPVMERRNWTESFIRWSPSGNYLLSVHRPGIQIWGGADFRSRMRFAHPNVNLVDFSPNEKYLCTWSNTPIQYTEGHPIIGPEDDGKSYIIWEVATGKLLRSFASIETPGPTVDENGQPIKKKVVWPAFKWSADDKFVARSNPGQSLSVYELPGMALLDKQTIKVDGIVDFEWSPSTPSRADVKGYEQLICYWTPEIGATPAKVALVSIPSKEIVRTRNLFNVTDCKLHWQSESAYICCKVDRHLTKRGKTVATNLEIFRVKEKGVPVEVIDSVKEGVINFSWEPKGNRFVLITQPEAVPGGAPPKTAVLFFTPEKSKGNTVGNFKQIRTIDRKTSNAIYWSPKGRFVIVATVHSQNNFDLDFWDLDFEGEKPEAEKDLTANLQLMGSGEHFGVTDVEWDPTGRYVASVSSAWRHSMENGYHLYDFKGTLLREEHIDRFFQLLWRPRPPTLLTKDDQKAIRKNIREYSRQFEEEDQYELDTANMAVVEARRAQFQEWLEWRQEVELDLREERNELGLPEDGPIPAGFKDQNVEEGEEEIIEELVEEVVFEEEEVIS